MKVENRRQSMLLQGQCAALLALPFGHCAVAADAQQPRTRQKPRIPVGSMRPGGTNSADGLDLCGCAVAIEAVALAPAA
ncbi:hypothetical protein [Cupriavidus malaysiensis]|uniref:Uncharacterized protein n=1 Tax=Cupriavidus malaysiensis TaxID=367825 RepID=A0ABM6F1H8_9BURK|nr:hypothetical protein [Cupriavidus malaysiensis]AOZ04920.1 hypothetical protein BKK80_03060 [Cupriavidus malaysiensis]